jgi:hypothetical protein
VRFEPAADGEEVGGEVGFEEIGEDAEGLRGALRVADTAMLAAMRTTVAIGQ